MTAPNINPAIAHKAVPVGTLTHFDGNARTHDLEMIAASLKANGQYKPITVRKHDDPHKHNVVLAGNGTLEAARDKLGWESIAVEWVECDDRTARRIVLIDNKSNDVAGYDNEALIELLRDLEGDYEGTGFVEHDLDKLVAEFAPLAGLTDPDDVPRLGSGPTVTQEGDSWILGQHRVLCGDATDLAGVLVVLDGDRPDCVWTDPPYGVEYVGGTKDALTIQNDSKADLPELLLGAFTTIAQVCRPGAPVYIAHADSARMEFEGAMREAGLLVRQNLIWVKNALIMGRADYHYQHEPILQGEVDQQPEGEGDELEPLEHDPVLYGFTPGGKGRLGRGGQQWYGGNNAATVLQFPKPAKNPDHPTMKPVALIESMLKNSLRPGGLVLDLFGGSGSTLIAAHQRRSRAVLVELDPKYVDVICRRYQSFTGELPVSASTGKQHDFL